MSLAAALDLKVATPVVEVVSKGVLTDVTGYVMKNLTEIKRIHPEAAVAVVTDVVKTAGGVSHTLVEITDASLKPLKTIRVDAGGETGLLHAKRAEPLDLGVVKAAVDLTHPLLQGVVGNVGGLLGGVLGGVGAGARLNLGLGLGL